MNGQVGQKYSMQDTKERYRILRRAAHRFTMDQFKQFSIEMRDITHSDAVQADKWGSEWDNPQKVPSWAWERMYHEYQTNGGIKRYEASLISNGCLCALCYGVPTSSKLTLRIHAIARKPQNNPLAGHILDIMLFSANAYARLLRCKEIWIVEPMNEALVRRYQGYGYAPCKDRNGKTTHLTVQVNYD